MKIRIVLLIALIMGTPVLSPGQEPARRALAEQLLEYMNVREAIEKSFEMVKRMVPAQLQSTRRASEDPAAQAALTNQINEVMALVSAELSWEKLKPDYVTLYADTFSEEELRGLIDFYKSPAGQAFSRKQPELMRRSMELGQRLMRQVMPKIQTAVEGTGKTVPVPPRREGEQAPQ